MTRPVRVLIRLAASSVVSLLALASLGAQQPIEADKALLAAERYVKPPAEVARL